MKANNVVNIVRTARKDDYTIGKLYINGEFFCHTLEPTDTTYFGCEFKLGASAIPVGVYQLASSVWSPKFQDYRPRVKGFAYSNNILIHEGNTRKDTEGCILMGNNLVKGKVLNSKANLKKVMKKLDEQGLWSLVIT